MKIEKFVIGPIGTNCYVLVNEETKEVVIVDPAACPDEMVSHIKAEGYVPRAILLTHAHYDHILGIDEWVKQFDIPVYLHEEEKEVLENPALNLSGYHGQGYVYESAVPLKDQEVIRLAGMDIRVIFTPGHTKGGCCYYLKDEKVLMSGDTLFYHSVGRSDLPTGNMGILAGAIQEKLFSLPDDVVVYPGHDIETSIGDEKVNNPFV